MTSSTTVGTIETSLTLEQAGLSISPVAFGCASLLRLPSARERAGLIAAAIDAGVTHFDVARMYGLGAAEGELGRALRGRREQLTVATKFGIDASGGLARLGRLQAPARALLAKSSKVRSAVRSRRDAFATPRSYDAGRARVSLDRSLLELGLDHVEILFLHDPRPHDEVDGAALVAFLEDARSAGKIRAWGVSLDAASGLEVLPRLPGRGVLQLRYDVLAPTPDARPAIAFGVMSAHAAIGAWLRDDPSRRQEWTAALGADPLDGDQLASLLVAEALRRPGVKSVLYATTQPARLAVPRRTLQSPLPAGQVDTFAGLIAAARSQVRLRSDR